MSFNIVEGACKLAFAGVRSLDSLLPHQPRLDTVLEAHFFFQFFESVRGGNDFGILFDHFRNDGLSLGHPFLAILHGIIQVLVTTDTEYGTILELFTQRNHVVIKKANLALVPKVGRVLVGTSVLVRLVHFFE